MEQVVGEETFVYANAVQFGTQLKCCLMMITDEPS
jgi:hypothetical protein